MVIEDGRGFVKPNFFQKAQNSLGNTSELSNITRSTDPNDYSIAGKNNGGIQKLPVSSLVPFPNHPFKLYTGQRKYDMVESIRISGVLNPLIVRLYNNQYQILSGHNRWTAAKEVGLYDVPVVIMNNITDDEAMLIVTETNLYQRSFSDLSHSERARALTIHVEANKHQGKRNDLILEIENMLKASDSAESETLCHDVTKLDTLKTVGDKYGLSRMSISRYLRIDKLNDVIKKRLDDNEITLVVGVAISYISDSEQEMLDNLIERYSYKVDIKKAELLRSVSAEKKLDENTMRDILEGTYGKKPKKAKKRTAVTVKPAVVNKYFSPYESEKEVVEVIDKSLEIYMENKEFFEAYPIDEIKAVLKEHFGGDSDEEDTEADGE